MACLHDISTTRTPSFKRVLWIALILNATMFLMEIFIGIQADSVSLIADSIDFLSDATNYGISLTVLPMTIYYRSKASIIKGSSMIALGGLVAFLTVYQLFQGKLPNYSNMGVLGVSAMFVNVVVAVMLYRFRDGESNMRSVWLCSRNDVLGNIAVVCASYGVYLTQTHYPDLIVAVMMTYLTLSSGMQIIKQANQELTQRTQPNSCCRP
ncbi:cation transporter [Otariodibacter sp.]|uniref:cation transporter n=1 Tax=Otariodibacter sp. TaxID=3030919 RepID=UPI00261F0E30|nr:cation transporter [Otariodibacter sp.]